MLGGFRLRRAEALGDILRDALQLPGEAYLEDVQGFGEQGLIPGEV